jgi:RNA polymerase sigma-70 factor (ECF subfamily)
LKYRSKKNNLGQIAEYNADLHDSADTTSFFSNYDEKELLKLVQSLSPVYRMVFNLYVLEGFKHKEIAKLLGISEGTSKSNLADARIILQRKVL